MKLKKNLPFAEILILCQTTGRYNYHLFLHRRTKLNASSVCPICLRKLKTGLT
ncbi:hypothetical protein Cabys_1183 [Caldithrix abyssi DSM 13497]|uniref:Uncharacterized protein n=1 Tax=Caldithrix abyssi DSM 13497 TaxID=880073 RepID=A0A1J1C6A6_CALAY|nr:hypothetical protein Cabys_1183 [Caldithrix abyssi DSM 13497]